MDSYSKGILSINMAYTILFEENPAPHDVQVLGDGILAYAQQQKGLGPIHSFAFFVRDDDKHIVGGVTADILYGCLWISYLWVSEPLRNKGYGTQLMQAVEKYGKEYGCLFATVNTMDWEALEFYTKLGFYVEFERKGFLKDSVFYFLRKEFNKP